MRVTDWFITISSLTIQLNLTAIKMLAFLKKTRFSGIPIVQ